MVKNILVIKHGSFGDIIQINGCLKDIREHYSKHKIYILTTPAFNNYFGKCPFIDEVILDKRKSRWNLIYLYQLKKFFSKYNKTSDRCCNTHEVLTWRRRQEKGASQKLPEPR